LEETKAAFNTRENKKKLRALMKQTEGQEGQDMMQKMGSVIALAAPNAWRQSFCLPCQ
jgi:hypothetical protein